MQFKRDKRQNSNKLKLDKYYTSKKLAKYIILKTYEIIGAENITEVIEPSAGNGAFSSQIEGCIAYDIQPEGENIIKQDFLELKLDYKEGRLFIGNPPFGDRLNLTRKFMKKHYNEGDYIAYILPISQIDNNYNFYEFNLLHSEDLGLLEYSGRHIHCCFNIYKRPQSGLNKRKDLYRLPIWIRIEEQRKNQDVKRAAEYTGNPDVRICSWGSKAGEVVNKNKYYAKELGVYIDNNEYKNNLVRFLQQIEYKDFEWASPSQSPNITIWRFKQHIIDNFLKPNGLYNLK